tara:strand:- start:447 stop:1157 length:711 start_codon:yes stop_codon:yes gene_type:complete
MLTKKFKLFEVKFFIKYFLLPIISFFILIHIYKITLRSHHIEHNIFNSNKYKTELNSQKFKDLQNCNCIILGDSRSRSLNIENCINFSIGGETINLLRKKIHHLNFPNKVKILINVGINDILFSYSLDEILINFDKLKKVIDLKTKSSSIHFIEIFPIDKSGFFYKKDDVNFKANNLNTFLKSFNNSKFNNYEFLTLKGFSYEFLNENSQYSDDGIHLNKKGNELFSSILESYINE